MSIHFRLLSARNEHLKFLALLSALHFSSRKPYFLEAQVRLLTAMRAILIASGLLAGMLTLHGCGGGDEEPTSTDVTEATPKPATAAPTSPTDESADPRSTESCQVLEPTIPAISLSISR